MASDRENYRNIPFLLMSQEVNSKFYWRCDKVSVKYEKKCLNSWSHSWKCRIIDSKHSVLFKSVHSNQIFKFFYNCWALYSSAYHSNPPFSPTVHISRHSKKGTYYHSKKYTTKALKIVAIIMIVVKCIQ